MFWLGWEAFRVVFSAFGLNTEIYSVNLNIQSEWGKIRTRETQNSDTFYVVVYVGPCQTLTYSDLWK